MTFLILLQSVLDCAIVFWLVRQYLESRRAPVVEKAALPDAGEWEKAIERYRAQCDDSLKRLHSICDQAARILQQNKGTNSLQSKEENELKEVAESKPSLHKIPSLEQIESTRVRLKKDIPIDLRTLLKDQLA
jgi:hypothetical protein